jgi:beta-glucosidase/6-phospho-beta-glucosidase/beta-galactosidase
MSFTHAEPILSNPSLKSILPSSFLYACSSASYQIEGGFEADGKGVGIWDEYMRGREDNGEVACDSYNLWREDVKLLKEYGCNSYRFSIAWPRIIPNGASSCLYYHDRADDQERKGEK